MPRETTRRWVPASSDRLSADGFLLLGASVGLVGWTVTGAVELLSIPRPGLVVLACWLPLVAVMSGALLFATPDAVRFSLPLVGWGILNGATIAATVVVVVTGGSAVTVWSLWVAVLALGYAWTARALRWNRAFGRAALYGYASLLAIGVLVYHAAGLPSLRSVRYPVIAALHALPLVLDARSDRSGAVNIAGLYAAVFALVALGWVL
jgi:hypothetical protein